MLAPLEPITIESIYALGNIKNVPMPERMAFCTPDTKQALFFIDRDLRNVGGKVVLSDLYRSRDMQYQAYLDYTSGKKKAFSPAPGGSMHEAGRAFDLDLSRIKVSLDEFWKIAAFYGVVPIIAAPNPKTSESWHFECRGSYQKVYDYYAVGKGTNFKPAAAMAAAAILGIGVPHDSFPGEKRNAAFVQAALIRLGYQPGNMDGALGPKTSTALKAFLQVGTLGISDEMFYFKLQNSNYLKEIVEKLDRKLQLDFPAEYFYRISEV